jgi:hypothetical protein
LTEPLVLAPPPSEVGTLFQSASTSSIDSGGLGLTKKARRKRNRRLGREAEKRERLRIGRDYANHEPAGFGGSDAEYSDDASEVSESTEMSSIDAASSVDS